MLVHLQEYLALPRAKMEPSATTLKHYSFLAVTTH